MCGRINVSDNEGVRLLLESMGMDIWPGRDPRYNIAPTQTLDVVSMNEQGGILLPMHWGFALPLRGASGKTVVKNVQNTRSDKVWTSGLWKRHIKAHRVLIPVNGFYEWKRHNKKLVAAFHIAPAEQAAMFLAGIYRPSRDSAGMSEVSVITTEANHTMSDIHDRMPVILTTKDQMIAWLQDDDPESLNQLMQPTVDAFLSFSEVTNYVNKSSNDGPQCIVPAA